MKNNRRQFLKQASLAGAGIISGSSAFGILTSKKIDKTIVGHGDFTYRVDKEWGIQDANKFPVNDCHEMVQDRQGRLILLTNHEQNNILVYDKSGKVVDHWTLNLPGAHGLTLAEEGETEVLFMTDEKLGKVIKTDLKGKVLLELETPKEVSIYSDEKPFKPTEVAVAPNGDFYVADGYGQNFIIQYSSKGEYMKHFGGSGDGEDQFACCHGVTLDTRVADQPTLLITSRSKQSFKRFSLDGEHLETTHLPGCWICRPVIHEENLYFAVIVTKTWDTYDGMVAVLDKDNQIVSLPGGSMPTYQEGILQAPTYDGDTFFNPHDVCVDDEGNLYVPQWNSGKTYPVKLERV